MRVPRREKGGQLKRCEKELRGEKKDLMGHGSEQPVFRRGGGG